MKKEVAQRSELFLVKPHFFHNNVSGGF